MNARITCPGCQRVLHLPGACLGQLVQCPACASSFVAETDHGVPVAVSPPEVAPVPAVTITLDDPAAAIQTKVAVPVPTEPKPVPALPEDWLAQGVVLLAALPLGLPILALFHFLSAASGGAIFTAFLIGSLGVGVIWCCTQLAFVSARPARTRFITSLLLSGFGYGVALLTLANQGSTAPGASIPGSQWVQYRSPEGDFSILFPGHPTRRVQAGSDQPGGLPYVTYQLDGSPQYMFQVVRRPLTAAERMAAPAFDIILNQISAEVVRQTGLYLRESRSLQRGPYPGKELTLDGPDRGRTVVHVLMVGQNCYVLLIQSSLKGQPTNADLTRFFDSFSSLR